MSTCPFLSKLPQVSDVQFFNACGGMLWCRPAGRQNRLTAESKCGDAGNRKQSLWQPGYSEKSTYWNLPWTSKVKFKADMCLGLCNGNCTKSGKKVDRVTVDLQKENCLSWAFLERKLMFNNMHCVSFFRSLKGRGCRITALFFHPRQRST